MKALYRKALIQADETRAALNIDMFQPLNIIDACIDLGLTVRFVDVSMEGLYLNTERGEFPQILISNQRPLPRRFFTCAHELGHHIFEHGFKIDGLTNGSKPVDDSDEYLVDTFAGALLMPIAGVQEAFARRNISPQNASPIDFYTVSSAFSVGYSTLITHCKVNRLITDLTANRLFKVTPLIIFQQLFGSTKPNSHFKIIDKVHESAVTDIEVTNYIILPSDFVIEGSHCAMVCDTDFGTAYIARKPGIVRAIIPGTGNSFFIRIQNHLYSGLAEYRHLESE